MSGLTRPRPRSENSRPIVAAVSATFLAEPSLSKRGMSEARSVVGTAMEFTQSVVSLCKPLSRTDLVSSSM